MNQFTQGPPSNAKQVFRPENHNENNLLEGLYVGDQLIKDGNESEKLSINYIKHT